MTQKTILKIESYSNGKLTLIAEDFGAKAIVKGIAELCLKKHDGFIKVEMSPPYRSRTTGKNSQHSKFYALVQEICNETGNDIEDVKDYLKDKAVRRGYPVKVNPLNKRTKPVSTTKVNTVEMSYLIEEALQLAAELGIVTENY